MNRCEEIHGNPEELMHYGVKGMRWGVRRASKQLTKATTAEGREKAIATLNKHRTKGSNKITSLEKERVKLDDMLRKATTKDKVKASKLEAKAAKLDRKAAKNISKSTGMFTSSEKSKDLLVEAELYKIKSDKLHAKASSLNANYEKAKAKVDANESMQKAFRTEISKIDKTLEKNGRRYING